MNKTLPLLLLVFAVATPLAFSAQGPSDAQPGDGKAGVRKVAICIGCHGIPRYQASFPEVHKVPMISGQTFGYIAAALNGYRKGDRKHPTMRGIATSLTDQDIADVATLYAEHGRLEGRPVPTTAPAPSSPDLAALLKRGGCVSCHGSNFNQPIDINTPKLAGQYADYLFAALKAYKTDANPLIGRSNAVMVGAARQFTNAELRALAQYIATLPGELRTLPQARLRGG